MPSISVTNGPIQRSVDIDEVLMSIAAIQQDIEHFEALKKHRAKVIDEQIAVLESRVEGMREQIRDYMSSAGEKTLKFPGVGSITRKPGSMKWVVNDEEKLVNYLKGNSNIAPQTLEKVIVTKETIVKKELNKILDDLEQHNALKTDSVSQVKSDESVAITFDKSDAFLANVKEVKADLISKSEQIQPALPEQAKAAGDALEF